LQHQATASNIAVQAVGTFVTRGGMRFLEQQMETSSQSIVRAAVFAIVVATFSGCAVADLAGTTVKAGATVARTTVYVATDVMGAPADTVGGSSKNNKKSN
jgi:hypothetical protein